MLLSAFLGTVRNPAYVTLEEIFQNWATLTVPESTFRSLVSPKYTQCELMANLMEQVIAKRGGFQSLGWSWSLQRWLELFEWRSSLLRQSSSREHGRWSERERERKKKSNCVSKAQRGEEKYNLEVSSYIKPQRIHVLLAEEQAFVFKWSACFRSEFRSARASVKFLFFLLIEVFLSNYLFLRNSYQLSVSLWHKNHTQ